MMVLLDVQHLNQLIITMYQVLLYLPLQQGAEITISAEGDDAEAAITALTETITTQGLGE